MPGHAGEIEAENGEKHPLHAFMECSLACRLPTFFQECSLDIHWCMTALSCPCMCTCTHTHTYLAEVFLVVDGNVSDATLAIVFCTWRPVEWIKECRDGISNITERILAFI